MPPQNESVFYHAATRTLICADAVHNAGADRPFSNKLFLSLVGGYGGFKTNLLDRLATRDKAASRASVERILAWDFERVVMAHGTVLEQGGKDAFRRAYAWLGV